MAVKTQKFTTHTTGPTNQPPVSALAVTKIDATIGSIIQLDGRKSRDPEGQPLTYRWTFTQKPIGSLLDDTSFRDIRPRGAAVSFTPDKTGLYVVQLVVNDGELDSEPISVTVNVQISRVPCGDNIVPDAQFLWKYLSNFWNLVEDREYITAVWSSVIQTVGAEIIRLWVNDYNKSIDTIQTYAQRRWLQFPATTYCLDQEQRLIVGKTSDGTGGKSGALGRTPGVGYTDVFRVLKGEPSVPGYGNFESLRGNYGFKGRIICVNGEGYTINQIAKALDPVTSDEVSLAIMDEPAIPDGIVGAVWRIPHLLHTPDLNLEDDGVRAGDVIVFEVKRQDIGVSAELRGQVVCVDRHRLGFEFTLSDLTTGSDTIDRQAFRQLVVDLRIASPKASDTEIASLADAFLAFMPTGINLSKRPFSPYQVVVSAKKIIHNTFLKVGDDVFSVPTLQETPKDPPVVLRENLDYVVESGGIQFTSGLFKPTDAAPELFHAECTYFDNSGAIERNFGKLVGLDKDDLVAKATRAPYLSAVKGLMYAMTNGPSVQNLRLGLQILMGLPFTEETGVILEITPDFAQDARGSMLGRILIEDVDQYNRKTGFRRSYLYPMVLGLDTNITTGQPFKIGDPVGSFIPLSKGVDVVDYIKDPYWWTRALNGLEVMKFFTFKTLVDSQIFDINDAQFALEFIRLVKAAYTNVISAITHLLSDDIGVVDAIGGKATMRFYDNSWGLEACNKATDDNQQGFTLWHAGSPPFQTRVLKLLRDVRTYKDGTSVKVSSVTGWDSAQLRGHTVGVPVVEGDLLVIMPGQPGAGESVPGLYEISDVLSDNLLQILQEASFIAPITFAVTPIDEDLFEYGDNLVCTIVRRGSNPIVMGSDLVTTNTDSVVTSASSRFKTDAVSPGDSLIIERGTDLSPNPNMGEYFVDATTPFDPGPPTVPPDISETQLLLRTADGGSPIFTASIDQEFRIVRRDSWKSVVYGAKSYLDGVRMMLAVLDPVTSDPLDVFSPGMIGSTVEISNSDKPANDGPQIISDYINSGLVALDYSTSTESDTVAQAVIHF